ncbi:MAG: hypothetical protein ACO1Q7_08410 [Gemmatimonas sp.]
MLQGEASREDMIFGGAVLAVFLVIVFVLGFLLNRFKNRRFRNAWMPLASLLTDVRITEDGGGAATSWLSGKFHGRLVHASMSPDVAQHSFTTNKGNHFSIIVPDVVAGESWFAEYAPATPLLRKQGWTITTESRATHDAIERSEILPLVQSLGYGSLRYNAGRRQLVWQELIEPLWVLPPAQFTVAVRTMFTAADIAQQFP